MIDIEKYEITRKKGVSAAMKKSRVVHRSICGYTWRSIQTTKLPVRKFDTEQGDRVPYKMTELDIYYRGVFHPTKVLLFLGDHIENPTFGHVVGRRQLMHERTLKATVEFSDHSPITLPFEDITVQFDSTAIEPGAVVTFLKKRGMFRFPGPWDLHVKLTCRDSEQFESMQTLMMSIPESASDEELV